MRQIKIPPLKLGDTLENAVWLSGRETEEDLVRYTCDVENSIRERAEQEGFVIGPIHASVKYPGEERVPPVPDQVSGPDVRMLVYEADVIARLPVLRLNSFLADYDAKDILRLREITRMEHRKVNPVAPKLSDAECDAVAEEVGPESVERMLRNAVNTGTVH